ncbi:MAG: helix-turn-helix domain-containing protein [Kineosporiaceae bacterium]
MRKQTDPAQVSGNDAGLDRRVRRTRAALRQALLELVVERGYAAVTVQDVIDAADLGRSTFYAHYRDKDDLLLDGLADLRTMLLTASRQTAQRRWLRFGPALLEHLSEMRTLVRAVLQHEGNATIRRALEATLTELVEQELRGGPAAPAAQHPAPRSPRSAYGEGRGIGQDAQAVRVRYVVGAFVAVLTWWLTEQPQLRPEEVDGVLCTLLCPGLEATAGWR